MPRLADYQSVRTRLIGQRDAIQQLHDSLPELRPIDAFPELLGDALAGQPPLFAHLLTAIGNRPQFAPQVDAFMAQPDGAGGTMADHAAPGTIEAARQALAAVDADPASRQAWLDAGQAVRTLLVELFPPNGEPPTGGQ